jgi:hypothetical protein
MERFIVHENIRSFKERLSTEDDPGRRGALLRRLVEEEAKLAFLKRRSPKNAFAIPRSGEASAGRASAQ